MLASSPETPQDLRRLFGFGFYTSPAHFTLQVLFLNIPFPKSGRWDYKVTNRNFQKWSDFRPLVGMRVSGAEGGGGEGTVDKGRENAGSFCIFYLCFPRICLLQRVWGYIGGGPAGQHPNASAFCLPPTLHPTQRPRHKIQLAKQERSHLITTRTAKVKKTGSYRGWRGCGGTRARLHSGGSAEPL